MTLTYILVEGPHDAAFVAKVLTLAGLRLVNPIGRPGANTPEDENGLQAG